MMTRFLRTGSCASSWIRALFETRRRQGPIRRPRLEALEDRLAPASFTTVGTSLAITLDNANETASFSTDLTHITVNLTNGTATNGGGNGGNITGFGTSTATITSSAYTSINITDSAANESVAFTNSTGSYPQAFTINLSDPASGNVTFSGASTFTASFSATTSAGFIASDAGSSLTVSGSGSNLTLNAAGHDILLQGSVSVGGTTSLTGGVVQINNPANSFTGALSLTGPVVASVFATGALNLGASTLNFDGLGQTTQITATGSITQSGALTTTGSSGMLDVTSTGGSITLTNPGNSLSNAVPLGLSVTGTNTVTVSNGGALTLGNVTLGTGALTLTAGGSITQASGTTIQTGGAVSATVSAKKSDILLGNAGNQIAGAVTVAETGNGFLRNVSLGNAANGAVPPTGTPITNGSVNNLTLVFDNNGVVLPGYNINGNLTVTAGGDVSQSAALNIGGNTTVAILGDFGITLANNANVFSGSVGLNATQSTQPIQIVDSTALTLATSNLGQGTFSATALSGNLTSGAAITQRKGAGTASFTVPSGNTISLTGANDFPGTVNFTGATTLKVRNVDFQAAFANLTGLSGVTDLTVTFDNAGVVLASMNLTNLTVTALGISQTTSSSILVTGTATFSAGDYPIALSNTGNNIANLTLNTTGRNDVTVNSSSALAFTGTSSLGTGRLTVTASGNITETNGTKIIQANTGPAGDVSFTSMAGSVSLPGNGVNNVTNTFRGPFSVNVSGGNTASVTNSGAALVLSAVTTGAGGFTAVAGSQGISQDPNSILNIGGTASFTANGGGSITLNGANNSFAGAVSLSANNAALTTKAALSVGPSNVSGTLILTTTGGSISQTGAITGDGFLQLNAGSNSINLTTGNNAFSILSISSTGSSVAVNDSTSLSVGNITVGGGTLTLTTGGNLGLAGAGSNIVQTTGTGTITLATPANANISLGSSTNVLLGTVNLSNPNGANNVTLQTQGNLTVTSNGPINGNLTLTAGGVLTLPSNLTTENALTVSAVSTTVGSDITAGDAVTFQGAVTFTGNRAITAAGPVIFNGNVTPGGTLTFTLSTNQPLELLSGTWNEGSNALTINGAGVQLLIGNSGPLPARLIMAGGTTLSMPGNGNVTVNTNGTLQAGTNPSAQETVTLANGSGNLLIYGNLAIGFGATNDELIKTGSGLVSLGTMSQLVGSGLAGTTATPVLASQTALIIGTFANSVDNSGNPKDFFAGSDIVTPAYSFTQVTIKAGGTASTTGTATGFLPDGDTYTVTSSLGKSANLATVVDVAGNLDVVVRNTSATAAATLTITTTGGGDGLIPIGGVSIQSPGAVTVTATAGNFTGMFTTAGTLTSLTARNLGTLMSPFTLSDGGLTTASTTITAGVVANTTITLMGTLGSFTTVSVGGVGGLASLTAQKFGTITTKGNAATLDLGNFNANLVSTTAATGTVVTTATIAGTLGGTWDVRGNIGTVKAASTASWTLGTVAAANIQNGGLLAAVTSLSLGPTSSTVINATGAVVSLTATQVSSSNFTAGSFGTVSVTGNSTLGMAGNFTGSNLTATSSAAGVALNSLNIAGDLSGSSALEFENGDVNSITVGRTVSTTTITATDTGTRGNLKAITAGAWQSGNVVVRTIGSLKVIGNLADNLFGNFSGNVSVSDIGTGTAGVALGTFSASGSVSSSTFTVSRGSLTTFTVGRQLGSTTVRLTDTAFGNLGTIQAGDWTSGVFVLARTIGTVASVGAAATSPASPLLLGGISGVSGNPDIIRAFLDTGTTVGIGTLTTKGDLSNANVIAPQGITTLSVGRNVGGSNIVADGTGASLNVGGITTLTAGAWTNSALSVNTLGTINITGYATLETSSSTFTVGNVTSGSFLVHGSTKTAPVGIGTFTVAGGFASSTVIAPFGINTMTVKGSVTNSQVVTANATTAMAGFLTSFAAGELSATIVRANSIGTLKTTGSTTFVLLGNIGSTTIAVTGSATSKTGPVALGTLSVAGAFFDSTLDAPGTVGGITVTGKVVSLASETSLDAGYATGSKLGSLTAAAWGKAGSTLTTDLISQSVATFSLTGNAAKGLTGTADDAFIDLLGAAGGVGLGTFTASGTVSNSLFRVANGDVTSFTVLRFSDSDLLVGFRPAKDADITLGAAAWDMTNHKIGTFKTTAPFSMSDATDSASFDGSDVVAAILGNVTLSGVDPTATNVPTFGVAFRMNGGAQGTVKTNGSATALKPGAMANDGQFRYLGLGG
jgi:hypothetical protein